MGLDVLTLLAGSGALLASVLSALKAWAVARRHRSVVVRIERDGNSVEINLDNPVQAEEFLEEFISRQAEEKRVAE